ncbi:MAG: hypothetical protein RBU27_12320 [Bacteroidota bacterium]|jgi:hypothetical protein|nr:hypothetical protein [Bacteroidota bacterium]
MRLRRVRATILLLVCVTVPTAAQVAFEFSGYVVDLPMYQRLDDSMVRMLNATPGLGSYDQDLGVNLTRLRLRPTLRLWEGATLALEHETDALYSSSPMPFTAAAGATNRQVVALRWQPVEEDHFTLQHSIDRFYFRQNLSWGSVVVGRQRIQWGTGRVWNPTDLFNPINPASFDKIEKDGADAVSVKLHLGSFTDLQGVVNFRRARGQKDGASAPDSTNVGLRFRSNFEEFDVALMSGWFDRRMVIGGDFAGNLFDAGVRGEFLQVFAGEHLRNSDYLRVILGVDYQITPEWYGLLEYLYNGEGHTEPSAYQLARLYQGEILQLNRKYLYAGATYLLHPLVTASAGLLHGLGDGSGFGSLLATWSSSDNSQLSAGVMLPYGGEMDEYTYYPLSLYLRGEFHF